MQRNNLCNKDAERQQKAQALETHLTIPKQAEQAATSTDSILCTIIIHYSPIKTFFSRFNKQFSHFLFIFALYWSIVLV